MLQRCQASFGPWPAASIQKRSPNMLVTARPRTEAIDPAGTVNGTMNQSFE